MKTTCFILLSALLLCGCCSQKQPTSSHPANDLLKAGKFIKGRDCIVLVQQRDGDSLKDIMVWNTASGAITSTLRAETGTVSAKGSSDANSVNIILYKRVLGNSKCKPLISLSETRVRENPGKWRCLFPQFAETQKSTVWCWFRRFSPWRFHAEFQGRRREWVFSRGSHDRIITYGVFPNTLYNVKKVSLAEVADIAELTFVFHE